MGKASRDKGNRQEYKIEKLLPGAQKVSRMYQPGEDLQWRHQKVEVKVRADGFRLLYRWLEDVQFLAIGADYQDPLMVMRIDPTLLDLLDEQ